MAREMGGQNQPTQKIKINKPNQTKPFPPKFPANRRRRRRRRRCRSVDSSSAVNRPTLDASRSGIGRPQNPKIKIRRRIEPSRLLFLLFSRFPSFPIFVCAGLAHRLDLLFEFMLPPHLHINLIMFIHGMMIR